MKISKLALFLAALCAITASPVQAGIELIARTTSASAQASATREGQGTVFDSDAENYFEFGTATVAASATANGTGTSASASGSASSQVRVDPGGMEVTGSSSASATSSATANPEMPMLRVAEAAGGGTAIVLRFVVTENAAPFTLTGNLSSSSAGGSASVFLRVPGSATIYNATASNGQGMPVSASGTLPPGTYDFSISAGGTSHARTPDTPGGAHSGSADGIEFIVASPAPSNDIEWINPAGGSFQEASNWDPQQVPETGDTAIFNLAGTYTVSLDSNATNNSLRGSGTGVNVTFELSGNTYTIDRVQTGGLAGENASFTFSGVDFPALAPLGWYSPQGPEAGGGLVRVNHTMVVSAGTRQSFVEQARASVATLDVEGSFDIRDQGTLVQATNLNVGREEEGIVNVFNGSQLETMQATLGVEPGGVFTSGGNGSVFVSGAGSMWHSRDATVGKEGTGTVLLSLGGRMTADAIVDIGDEENSTGLITIEDVGSRLTAGSIHVGIGGTGTLMVQDGSLVIAQFMGIGGGSLTDGSAAGVGHVILGGSQSQTGASLQVDVLDVGNNIGSSEGTLTIEDGGFVDQIGFEARVNNHGKILFNGGIGSFTELRISSGGELRITGTARADMTRLEIRMGGSARVGGSGSLVIEDLLSPGDRGTLQVDGTLQIDPGGRVAVGDTTGVPDKLRIGQGGVLSGTGTIIATEIVTAGDGSNQFTGAQISPGNSAGTLTLQGNFVHELGSVLKMEIAGTAADQFDVLHVTGNCALAGKMEVELLGNFLPAAGQSFNLLAVDGTTSGSFSEITFPSLKPGFQFSTEVAGGVFKLTALNNGLAANALLNISTRMQIGTGDDLLIAGFIVQGNEPKKVILRGLGPSLQTGGQPVPGRLTNPTLELRGSEDNLIFSNDDWMDSPQIQQIIDSTIPPPNDLEAAIVATLDPGAYTALLRGANGTTGIGLVEVYDLAANASANLVNVSSRGPVQSGDNVMIAGFISAGTTRVIARGIGPSLAAQDVAGALEDPSLDLVNANGTILNSNNNWKDTQRAEIEATTIPPPHDLEAALVATLPAGPYTLVLRGVNATSGIAVVEVYEL